VLRGIAYALLSGWHIRLQIMEMVETTSQAPTGH